MDFASVVADRAARISTAAGDPRAGEVFAAAMHRTLADTLTSDEDGTVFVITGDIPAMWLRDSTTQLLPYLRLLPDCPGLVETLEGVLRRQIACIGIDPYANAFNREPNGHGYDPDDLCDDPWVWEQKYEVDSLAFPVHLAHRLWSATGRTDALDERAHAAFGTIVELWRREQDHEERSPYRFERVGAKPTETLPRSGLGSPVARTGMTWSGFRPSDDACTYGYNVPANLFARRALLHIAELATVVFGDAELAADAARLAAEISRGIDAHGVVPHARYGPMFAYEVDGLGSHLLMDDANMPSLLALPLLDPALALDPRYHATRRFVLSPENPHFHEGTAAAGIGSPHTPPEHIWPISLAVEGLTSDDPARKRALLATLLATDAGTSRMHESFHRDDATVFTRGWFSWADSMFCELALDLVEDPEPA
jgi:uncharacterized protein